MTRRSDRLLKTKLTFNLRVGINHLEKKKGFLFLPTFLPFPNGKLSRSNFYMYPQKWSRAKSGRKQAKKAVSTDKWKEFEFRSRK